MHFWWRRGAAALLISGFLLGPGALARPGGQAGGGDLAAATAFQAFWQTHDGARLFGAPLAAPSQENGLTVQYYERARLEWHPSYPAGWQVTLGRLGAELLGARTFPRIAPFPSNPDHRYFAATGHSILGGLLRFWDAEGGLPVFGFPLSEELTEDGRTVQYFERARLEWHPELEAVGYQALATPLGALARQAPAVILEPPVLQEGHTAVIKVVPPPGSTVTGGSLNGNTLAFTCCVPLTAGSSTVAQPWAVAGAESYQSPDSLRLLVSLQGADGSTQQVERTLPVRRYPYPTARTTYYGPRTPQATRTAEHATLDAVFAGRSGPPRWSGRFVLPLHGAP
ncbi:MAG TPA: hypothetical protein VKY74_13020 [Chloroflexia bacterium]|nr:hypothetical protein [Chloroflexia bacterium]